MREFDEKSGWTGETVSLSSERFLRDVFPVAADQEKYIAELTDKELHALREYVSNDAAYGGIRFDIGWWQAAKAKRLIEKECQKRHMPKAAPPAAEEKATEEFVVPRDLDRDDTPHDEREEPDIWEDVSLEDPHGPKDARK